jgi:hypothetical protein
MSHDEAVLTLSARGLGNIPQSKVEKNFVFLIGGTPYDCPWFVADFLSPESVAFTPRIPPSMNSESKAMIRGVSSHLSSRLALVSP